MSTDPLPRSLDFRKAATRGASLEGTLRPGDLPRLRAMLAGDEGSLAVHITFGRDEERRNLATLDVSATLRLECQRCLAPFDRAVVASSELAAVSGDEQARQLPAHLEPVLVDDEVDLWELVEEEMVLSVPPFPCHDDPECLKDLTGGVPVQEAPAEESPATHNPFEVLSQLKEDGGRQTGE